MERLSQQDRQSEFCMDAGFPSVVEIAQYFMTEDTAEFSLFTYAVACREYTLPRDENHLTRKIGSEEKSRLDPYWKSQQATYKEIIEWKLEVKL